MHYVHAIDYLIYGYLQVNDVTNANLAITVYARALGAVKMNNIDAAKTNLEILDALYEKTKVISPHYWAPLVDAQRQTIVAWISFAQGNTSQAINQLRAAADLEDSLDKSPVTPAAVVPARELLGDMLMLMKQKTEASKAYQASLATNPNRLLSIKGLAAASQ